MTQSDPAPISQLQRELEELGARELRLGFACLQQSAAEAQPAATIRTAHMAIANDAGPDGQVYSVTVIMQRQPPRD